MARSWPPPASASRRHSPISSSRPSTSIETSARWPGPTSTGVAELDGRGGSMSTTTTHAGETEVSILARILCNEAGELPEEIARYILSLQISERDKARMHDLVVRNQDD